MIDNLLEEEKEMRQMAVIKGTDPKVLSSQLDQLWGKCTLYNAYQFFTNTTSKKLKNPVAILGAKMKADLEIEIKSSMITIRTLSNELHLK